MPFHLHHSDTRRQRRSVSETSCSTTAIVSGDYNHPSPIGIVPPIGIGKHRGSLCRKSAVNERFELAQRVGLCERQNLQAVKQVACRFVADLHKQLTIAIDAACTHRRFSSPSRLITRIIDLNAGQNRAPDEHFV
jgi:hypothetical protein